MQEEQKQEQIFENLPTGKPHISFSEMRDWSACSYRHKLKYIEKIDLSKPSPVLHFGTAVHAACEEFLKTKIVKHEIALELLDKAWQENSGNDSFTQKLLDASKSDAISILNEIPEFMNATFPDWECVDAEHQLYERLEKYNDHAFKGFIDGVIKCKGKRDKSVYWLIDWKTTSWGWSIEKKSEEMTRNQLILYKNFWAKKHNVDPKDIRCAFVLLKKVAKPGQRCELVTVSVGDVTTGRSLKVINNMMSSIKRGVAIKRRTSCEYCEYKDTKYCT